MLFCLRTPEEIEELKDFRRKWISAMANDETGFLEVAWKLFFFVIGFCLSSSIYASINNTFFTF
jgi:hypothetical protein